jgi:hypothetical protein
MLGAWHHHAYPAAWQGAPALAAAHVSASSNQIPATADVDCQFCFALSHHSAAPVDFFAALSPTHLPSAVFQPTAATRSLPSYFLFRSRAPPWV